VFFVRLASCARMHKKRAFELALFGLGERSVL
jgi:hypothetical protein